MQTRVSGLGMLEQPVGYKSLKFDRPDQQPAGSLGRSTQSSNWAVAPKRKASAMQAPDIYIPSYRVINRQQPPAPHAGEPDSNPATALLSQLCKAGNTSVLIGDLCMIGILRIMNQARSTMVIRIS